MERREEDADCGIPRCGLHTNCAWCPASSTAAFRLLLNHHLPASNRPSPSRNQFSALQSQSFEFFRTIHNIRSTVLQLCQQISQFINMNKAASMQSCVSLVQRKTFSAPFPLTISFYEPPVSSPNLSTPPLLLHSFPMQHPAPISPASNASFFHVSPSLHPKSTSAREDSSVEPRALKRACWPKSPIQHTPSASPPPRLPRSFTAPPNSFSSLHQPLSFDSATPSLFDPTRPVQLSPALTPSMRSALPQPKPLRPQPPPLQSDLSAASTRAENEPLAVRDLRRVTAPPALMDPWQYDRINRIRDRDRKLLPKSPSATSAVTVRADALRDKPAILGEQSHWRAAASRVPHIQRKFSRKKWFNNDDLPPLRIPDRFHDSFGERDGTNSPNDDSVISAITGESDPADDNPQPRNRAQSEMLMRRSSFAVGREKVISLWDRLRRRRRTDQQRPDKKRRKDRERRSKFSIFRTAEIGLGSHSER